MTSGCGLKMAQRITPAITRAAIGNSSAGKTARCMYSPSTGGIGSPDASGTVSPSTVLRARATKTLNGAARGGPSRNFRRGFTLTFVNAAVPGSTTRVRGEKANVEEVLGILRPNVAIVGLLPRLSTARRCFPEKRPRDVRGKSCAADSWNLATLSNPASTASTVFVALVVLSK